jgi:ankyrin repeat protein
LSIQWTVSKRWNAGWRALCLCLALAGLTGAPGFNAPAAAQFSDSFNFLKAVREKDGGKATELLDKVGNTLITTRDRDTGETALHIAARRSDATWVGFLVGRGADINSRDRDGNNPLLLAAQQRWAEGVHILIVVKAPLNEQNRLGETALQTAVQNRDLETVRQLVDAGANPDLNDNSGRSARSIADADPRIATIAKLFKDVPVRKATPVQGPKL